MSDSTGYTTGSVCSGVGGMDLGFHQAGTTPLWMCEFDPWRRKMLEHRFPGVTVHPDLNELDPADLPYVDVFHGGTPCQDFSQAGGREGLAGSKSMLFHHYVRIRDAIQPLYSVWENVLGAFSTNGGEDFAAVLGALVGERVEVPRGGWQRAGMAVAESGSWAVWRVLDAQWFGVAQRRRRVIVVASTRTRPRPEILLEPEGVCWNPAARGKARSTVALDARAGADGSGPQGGAISRCLTTSAQRIDADTETFVVNALTASTGGADDNDAQGGHLIAVPDTSPCLTSAGHDSSEDGTNRHALIAVSFAENQRGELVEAPVTQGLSTGGGKPGQGYAAIREGLNVRRLTPLEYERLQGFPELWTLDPDKGLATADGPRYAACGDAVAVPVAKWIATRIKSQMEAA